MPPQCTALIVSDETRCTDEATSSNGLFCFYHSKQCQGLYAGYKRRNARLDALDASPPGYLAKSSVALANQNFEDVESEEILQELYDYLLLKSALFERVIRARKLHHSRFFSLNLDYGHQHYLDALSNRKFIVVRALERLERRTAELLYKKHNWFSWVRQVQDLEETQRESEKKRVKKEAALFKRHAKERQLRMRDLRAREDTKRSEAFLEAVYKERMSEEEEDAHWDPIEDVIEDERGNYIDLIKHILLMTEDISGDQEIKALESIPNGNAEAGPSIESNAPKSSKKAKKSKQKALINGSDRPLLDKAAHDTASQIRRRLKEGVKLSYSSGMHVAGTIDNPVELKDKTAPFPDEEIDELLHDMAEVKHLLFCRLLLAHATVLPAAIKADSVEDFLNSREVTDIDLRDLAIKLDNPGLQEIRDACADLGRGEEEDDDEGGGPQEDHDIGNVAAKIKKIRLSEDMERFRQKKIRQNRKVPESWAPEREKQAQHHEMLQQRFEDQSNPEDKGKTWIDFGDLDDEGKFHSKKMRVKICGRYIYNYPSEKAISRGGWLQFCLIAKDSDLHDAIKLCRHWDEFFDLNILANFQYFPAANWLRWKGDRLRQQLLQLGFIPYYQFEKARELVVNHQSGSSRGQIRRTHAISEVRNFMCANIKRNDPATRRFLQYLAMQTSKVLVLIRDAKTGKILTSPPDDELWLNREKSGIGRASKNEWNVGAFIGKKFFEKAEKAREWHFGFTEYYDVYVWDLEPGEHFSNIYNTVQETLIKALRFCTTRDLYNPAESVLRTITRDLVTFRARDIKPGEQVDSIWDTIQKGRMSSWNVNDKTKEPTEYHEPDLSKFYNEADVLEDAILFPEQATSGTVGGLFRGHETSMQDFMSKGPDWARFIQDLDTDEEYEASDAETEYVLEDESHDEESDEEDYDEEDFDEEDSNEDVGKRLVEGTHSHESDHSSYGSIDNEASASDRQIVRIPSITEEEKQDLALIKKWKPPKSDKEDVEKAFYTFLDREKSKAFKRSWHQADLEPGAEERYREAAIIVDQMTTFNEEKHKFRYIRDLHFLGVHPHKHRRIIPDMLQARGMMALFFEPSFFESEFGILHKDSLIVNQSERAKNLPNRRTQASNKWIDKKLFEEWDTHWKQARHRDDYPLEWDVVNRPIIAKLYKTGVIQNSYASRTPGRAMAAKEPGRDKTDFYIDLRVLTDNLKMKVFLELPPSLDHFLITARKFSKEHQNARFAVLRLWSAPHFYPLMVGLENRTNTEFTDGIGRAWEFCFVPKDMPGSEYSIHHAARLRIMPFKHLFKEKVLIKRDLFLVMGEDEADLRKYAVAATFAIQTDPWRLEVDLWRSFVNVDMTFLERLQREWLD